MGGARAKGVPRHRILLVHALKNASIPLVTVLGLQVGFVLGGAFVVSELIYNWPGAELLALQATATRDFPVAAQGVVTAVATVFVLANLLVEVAIRLPQSAHTTRSHQ